MLGLPNTFCLLKRQWKRKERAGGRHSLARTLSLRSFLSFFVLSLSPLFHALLPQLTSKTDVHLQLTIFELDPFCPSFTLLRLLLFYEIDLGLLWLNSCEVDISVSELMEQNISKANNIACGTNK